MKKYYEIIGTLDQDDYILFGSFDREDCVFELDAEKDSMKAEGYKRIRMNVRLTSETPDPEVYS